MHGTITLQPLNIQGAFINICSYYWLRDGKLTLEEAKRRLTQIKPTAFDSLFKCGVLKLNGDNLVIEFLDEQLKEIAEKSVINSHNGSLGGRPKKNRNETDRFFSGKRIESEPKGIREDKDKDKSKTRDTETLTYGTDSKAHFIIVKAKYIHDRPCRIQGKAGLIEYMVANQTILNMPEYGDKFMRNNNGKVFNELSHVQNTYALFIEKQ